MSGLDREHYAALIEARVHEPESLVRSLRDRPRRPLVGADGNLFLLAADHTARGMIAVGGDPLAKADRYGLLNRLARGLADSNVDGVLASADILEELAWLGLLDGRLAIGTMNRGGIIGAGWELDDRLTAYDAEHAAANGLDGGKTLLRVELTDPGVANTLELVGSITTELNDLGLMSLIEPLPYLVDESGRARLDPSEERLAQVVAIASGLGSSSARTWLKIPASENAGLVAAATSCPILLLGGDAGSQWPQVFDRWERALAVPNVRGLVPGRPVLYPEELSVEEAVARAGRMVHQGGSS